MLIAVDLMAEQGPQEMAEGIRLAIKKGLVEPEQIVAIATTESLQRLISPQYPKINWLDCSEVVQMGEKFSFADRKRNTSINIGIRGLQSQFDAFISPGETSFVVGLAMTQLGLLKQGLKPAIAVPVPNITGPCLLLDAGAFPEADADDLVHFAHMGTSYVRKCCGLANPLVGLLNMGAEPTKGNDSLRLAYEALGKHPEINFQGNVEGTDLLTKEINVIVTSGLVGNVALKSAEGTKQAIAKKFGSLWQLSKLLYRGANREETGGAPLLGVNGEIVIMHGNSARRDVVGAIKGAKRQVEGQVNKALSAQ